MNKKDLQEKVDHFDTSDVTFEVEPSDSWTEVHFTLKSKRRLNLLKIYLALGYMQEKLELQLGITPAVEEQQ